MKRIFTYMFAGVLILTTFHINVRASENASAKAYEEEYSEVEKETLADFENLQNQITSTLTIKNGRYEFNRNKIHDLLFCYDVAALNSVLQTNYTNDSLEEKIVRDIESTIILPQSRGTYCQRNAQTWGWNFDRYFTDQQKTTDWAVDLAAEAKKDGYTSVISVILGPMGTPISVVAGIKGIYQQNLADRLNSSNEYCGVVTDINRYTSQYTVIRQRSYTGN